MNYAEQTDITGGVECTNRAGRAVEAWRADGGRRRDSRYEKRIPLMRDGHLSAQGDFVNRAGDTVPVIARYAEHTQIADGDEHGWQRQPQDRVNRPVKCRCQAPLVVTEVRGAAAQIWTVSVSNSNGERGFYSYERTANRRHPLHVHLPLHNRVYAGGFPVKRRGTWLTALDQYTSLET